MAEPLNRSSDRIGFAIRILDFLAALPAVGMVLLATAGPSCAKGEVVTGGGAGGVVSGGAGGSGISGAGGTTQVTIGTSTVSVTTDPADAGMTTQVVVCEGGDDACTCPPLNLAGLGKPGKWGANPNGDPDTALQDWLSSSSAGTARVDNFKDRTTLTADFLATYNVIILASLADDSDLGPWWTFTDDEVAAFRAWIQNGGGVISLTGYSSGNEIAPLNQLIGFSGISYNSDSVWGSCDDWSICNCTQSLTLSHWITSDPVIANLSKGVTMVGYTNGRSITSPSDGHVAATMSGTNALVGKLVGNGRVLAYGDEWITYTSQWTGAGLAGYADAATCQGEMPQDKYQTPQFWYNMIRWSYPLGSCFKLISTTSTPITIW